MTAVEVFADVVCPFAHVSLHRLVEARRASGREDVAIRVRAWPLELVNGEPTDPDHVAGEVRDLRDQVADDLFTGFRTDAFPSSSLRALGLAAVAYEAGDDVGEQVNLALRDALFEQGRPIGDEDVLADLASAFDLALPDEADARALAEADWREGQERDVQGSPHFFVAGASWFCPALRIEQTDDGFRIDVDTTRRDAFFAAAFPT